MPASVLPVALLVGVGILIVAVLTVKISGRLGLPSLLFFLGLGLTVEPLGRWCPPPTRQLFSRS